MRLSGTLSRAISTSRGLGNQLWDLAGNRPSLDLRFADSKSLVDATTGTTLVDHTRASSGTYVGSDGLIKTATTNLLLRSEEFNQSPWTPTNGTVTTNQVTAPNGSTTADLIAATATAAYAGRVTQTVTGVTANNYSISVYAKAGSSNFVAIGFVDTGFGNARGYFDLSTATSSSTSTAWTVNNTDIQNVGNGWYRCTMELSVSSTDGSADLQLYPVDGLSSNDVTSGNSVYIWGAQLEQSSTVGEYVKTTSTINSAPRFDHDPTTGESLGLLVEESRTNIVTYSEDFTDASYVVGGRLTVTANALAAPNGAVTADKLVATSNNDQKYVNTLLSVTSGFSYAFGMFAKKGEYEVLQLHFGSAQFSGTSAYANFNLNTGSIISSAECTPTIQDIGDGWYRCSVITPAATGTGDNPFRFSVYPSGDPGRLSYYTGDDTSGIYIWGAQLEAGSFPTSYIPTEGTTVTRAADVASISGSNFSSWYRQDEGTVFWSGSNYNTQYSSQATFRITEGSTLRGIGFNLDGRTGTDNANFLTRNNTGLTSVSSSFPYVIGNSNIRICGAFGADVAASFNGSTSIVSSPAYVFGTEDRMEIMGNKAISGTNFQYNGHTRRLTYWPTRLPNETLQTITQ